MMPLLLALAAAWAVVPRSAPDTALAPTPAATAPTPERSDRDQYALAADIAGAETGPDGSVGSALARARAEWRGRRYRWEVRFVPPLCQDADRCVVSPFDHARLAETRAPGWLPRLALDDGQHARLLALCADHRACVVTVEATLTELELSEDEPTTVTLADVRVVSARAATEGESWIRRRAHR